MSRGLLPVVLALALVPGAMGSSATKTIETRGEVVGISADGDLVAIHASYAGCDSGSVWRPSTGKVVRFQDTCETVDQYSSLTLAGGRVVWTDYDYGNHAYCAGPYTATLSKPKERDTGGCSDKPPGDLFWEYVGSGNLLVARSYTREPDYAHDIGVTIWSISTGLKKVLGVKDDTKLFDVDAGRILLRDPSKKLLVLNAAGKQVGVVGPVDSGTAFLSGAQEVVSMAKGTTLNTYDIATGKLVRTSRMKGEAKLVDVENGVCLYLAAAEVHLLTLATNRDRIVARQKGLVQADLEPAGLYYAYNVPGGGTKPGRVTFVPASALPK